jgi:HrpA-like RNA helicase
VGGESGHAGKKLTSFTHGCLLQQDWQTLSTKFSVVTTDEAHEQNMDTQLAVHSTAINFKIAKFKRSNLGPKFA